MIRKKLHTKIQFLELKNQILEEHYEKLHNIYKENAHLYHDMAHHLQMIYYLAQKEQNTPIMDYITSVSEPVQKLPGLIWSGVDIVDAIISHTVTLADTLGIKIDVNAEFPPDSTIAADDLCVILFNLLDNAIEHTKIVQNQLQDMHAPVISAAVRRIEKFLIIKVQNPCLKPPKKHFGRFFTTKSDSVHHGIGLLNVQKTAEKYGGNLETSISNGIFTATVLLFYTNRKTNPAAMSEISDSL